VIFWRGRWSRGLDRKAIIESSSPSFDRLVARASNIGGTVSPGQTIEAVGASGLKFPQLVELPPYHYGAVFKRPAS